MKRGPKPSCEGDDVDEEVNEEVGEREEDGVEGIKLWP